MKFISVVLVAFLFIVCSVKEEIPIKEIIIQDLVNIPQDIEYYTSYIQYDEYMIDKSYEQS